MPNDCSNFRWPGEALREFRLPQGGCVSGCRHSIQTLDKMLTSASSCYYLTHNDSDENPAVARAYSVSAMPTFVFIRNKSVIETLRGAQPSQLSSLVEKHSSSSGSGGSTFSGQGQTLSGGSVSSSSRGGQGTGGDWSSRLQGISRDNALPLAVLAGYLFYVFFYKE